ncbi:MAG: hypothetical protein HY928_03395 [Elusimicrobia bacterium]|nr:hypothetical protein [Elusimicrobiota bacterium]
MDLRPVGTAEDLFAVFARREYAASGPPGPKGPFGRRLVEPFFQAVGRAGAVVESLLPADLSLTLQDRLYSFIQDGPEHPFDPRDPALARAAALARRAEELTGRPAAAACLLAHAPVEPDSLYLNPAMFRHALKGLRAVRGRPCRPKLVNAVDAFALDMLDAAGEGTYAGFMSRVHLGFLRVTRARPWVGRALTAGAEWHAIAPRILRLLGDGGDLVMVLAGGIPVTARAYYAVREAVGRLCRASPSAADPAAASARLARQAPLFAAFRSSGEVGGIRSGWRLIEAWVMDCALTRSGRAALDAGRLDPVASAALVAVAAALEVPPQDLVAARKRLEAEVARETPFRERLLAAVSGRVAARGRAVVLLPLGWGRKGAVRLEFLEPVCLLPAPAGRARVLTPDGGVAEAPTSEFARDFVESRFI